MPIEGYIQYEDGNRDKRPTPAVEASSYKRVASDFSSGDERIFMVYCKKDGLGGMVSLVKKRELEANDEEPLKVLARGEVSGIGPGSIYERAILTEYQRVARLVLYITMSGESPESAQPTSSEL